MKGLIAALRIGRSLENPTPYKWFGLACAVIGLVLVAVSGFAAAKGWIDQALSLADAVTVASLVLGPLFAATAVTAVATTDKIGLPAARPDGDAGRVRGPAGDAGARKLPSDAGQSARRYPDRPGPFDEH